MNKILIFSQGDDVPPLGVYHRPFTICVKSAGENELEDLEEGADAGSGMGAWWRRFFSGDWGHHCGGRIVLFS